MPTPTNILWICSDQQRFDTLGCTGNAFVKTPNLDALAASGVMFERAFTVSPVCTPSRAAMLTGRYPRTTRCRQNGQSIPADEVLVTSLLARAGWTCGLSGKLHISACAPNICPTVERRIDDGYSEFHWSHHPNPDWPANEYIQWLRARGEEFRKTPCPESPWVQTSPSEPLHQTTWCVEKAMEFIRGRAGRPWLFSINMFDPHHPFDPPREYLERYLPMLDDIPLPNYVPGELDNKPRVQKLDHLGGYNNPKNHPYDRMTPRDHRVVRAAYWAMVDLIDAQVGRLLRMLDESGLRESTLVIFTSDHGEMLGDHGIYLKGPHFYEPAVRVPLIASMPGTIAAGRRSRAMVELPDLAPTLLDAAGLPRHPGMQAKSLWPILAGEKGDRPPAGKRGLSPFSLRDDVYCEYYNALTSHKDPTSQATMVRSERYKLVAHHGEQPGELYDIEADPNETRNLWDDPSARDAKIEMLQRLADRMAWTVDPLPPRESRW